MRAKKYLWSILCVYFCYLTHGIQAIILSQNNVNFAKQWGFNIGRLENSPAELSSWAILPAGTHGYFTQPAYFGKIQFK